MIDKQKIVDILTNYDVEYWLDGKNVTSGWVNIQCIFCDDHSNHLGINCSTELYSCWKCGAKNHFVDLLMTITGLAYGTCKEMISESTVSFKERPLDKITSILQGELSESKSDVSSPVCKLPERFELITEDTWSPLLDSYQERRNILRSTLIDAACGFCRSGKYMNRMIIPVMHGGKLVAYQAADLAGTSNLKYQSSPLSMGNINDYLYGIDAIDRRMIVVEGVLDKWRTGKEAVSSFTSSLSKEQVKLILAKELEELYLCYDSELRSYYKSRKHAEEFRAYIPVVEVVKLPFGKDPDEIGQEKIYQLIDEL